MARNRLRATIAASRAILFDFDGPICDVFAGLPAHGVARDLSGIVDSHDAVLGGKARGTDDPMEILRLAPHGGDSALRDVEDALTAAEIAAVKVAGGPVAGAVAALSVAYASGRKVAVVSNNSAECVRQFLAQHELTHLVHEVIGRAAYRPDLMKPAPSSLLLAAERLSVKPGDCTLIGDSVTDVEAARAAGAMSIGFANKPHKGLTLAEAGADAVVTDMTTVADALASSPG
ncbi:HAD family hydrolase [Streptomyces sioyaensis]|uniref:HAD family hydrolase n=1 Tax=Streptomyces sioyaensis TaxID=67364 RepID=UPI0036564495